MLSTERGAAMSTWGLLYCLLRAWILSRAELVAENLALHQQVAVLK